ncbi:ribosomal large subunit pseudouridine synthase A [Cellvibrio sp. BR]|jgi:tRNA pseudouridine32 synthase/23S rRNA pseudouridine746 synthase|uniref:pseudouridine synthase n=1 Tax=Cellvibrio sp. BR TaxID=1134474 RepID=UPI00026010EE|nr:pseudouridine synthase [Cellvibrio sp. BR]EIK45184.1 ribosomal large subunit pseudouridine synthase A [Cellvibrio sp. BR]
MTDSQLDILYLDEDLLIANKPAGLLCVPGKGPDKQDCLYNRALKFNPNARVVHRLDQGTSGIVMFPLNYLTLKNLTHKFEARDIHKRYVAVVEGLVAEDEGEITLPLICDWPNRPLQKVCFESGKSAHTRYKVLERHSDTNTTRVLLEPVSGRTHQLRVHMLSLGHPMLGDGLYAPADVLAKSPRLLLHAQELWFDHPITGNPLRVEAPAAF